MVLNFPMIKVRVAPSRVWKLWLLSLMGFSFDVECGMGDWYRIAILGGSGKAVTWIRLDEEDFDTWWPDLDGGLVDRIMDAREKGGKVI